MTTQPPKNAEPVGMATTGGAAGTVTRQEFGARQVANLGELSSQRAAAEAQAIVQARYVMALQRPRDLDDVRVKVLREVERPGFAEIAWYRKPVGQGVEGLSVRFAEAAARCMGNLAIEPHTTYEDETRRNVRVSVTDLESNLTLSLDVTVEKTVERSQLGDGREAISMRKNSQNKVTYLVRATEDEMLGKANSFVAKARRNLILQILPGDIADAAKKRILEIRRGAIAEDPEGARRKVVDAFAELNVMPSELKRWLGHDVAQSSPAEIQDLRDLHSTIKAGETSWADALAEKLGDKGEAAGAPPPPKAGLGGVTERLQGQAAAGAAAPTTGAAAASPARDCTHPGLPTSIPKGGSVTCTACGEEFTDDTPEPRTAEAKPEPSKSAAKGKGQTRLDE